MEHLSASEREELREMLLAERKNCLARTRSDPREAVRHDPSEPDPGDRQDYPSGNAALRTELAMSDHDRERLVRVEAALRRMDDGIYGICEETGEPIALARLRVEPTTRYTVAALEILEDEEARTRATNADAEGGLY